MTLRRFLRFCVRDPVLRPAAFGVLAVLAVLALSVWGELVDRAAFAATYGGSLLVVLVLAFVLVALAFVRSYRDAA